MSRYQTIDLDRGEDGVWTLRLNRPDVLNAMTVRMFEELLECGRVLEGEPHARVLILTGNGRGFCAGYDLNEADDIAGLSPQQMYRRQQLASRAVRFLADLPQPVIAAVNGPAAGGGLSLALAADIRLASTEARFNAAFVRIGLSGADLGASYFLPRLIGPARASELLFTGRFVDADEALHLGLVNGVHAPERLLEAAKTMAEQIVRNSPFGVELTKSSIQANLDASFLTAVNLENRGQTLVSRSADMHEAMDAFKSGHEPHFKGQ